MRAHTGGSNTVAPRSPRPGSAPVAVWFWLSHLAPLCLTPHLQRSAGTQAMTPDFYSITALARQGCRKEVPHSRWLESPELGPVVAVDKACDEAASSLAMLP